LFEFSQEDGLEVAGVVVDWTVLFIVAVAVFAAVCAPLEVAAEVWVPAWIAAATVADGALEAA
jgi:hypothetical protein